MPSSSASFRGQGMTSEASRQRLMEQLAAGGISSPTLAAMGDIPRHMFLDQGLAHKAYDDTSLPIGQKQTISQPYIVGLMTDLLLQSPCRRVLEVGTGSGYQTAVLSKLVKQVYSVERIPELLRTARKRLMELRMNNVHLKHADGYLGWPERAPFDGIIITAAPPEVSEALLEQLAEGGHLVVPLGTEEQILYNYHKLPGGKIKRTSHGYVRFVPMLAGKDAEA